MRSLKCTPQQKLPQLVGFAVSFASWDRGKHGPSWAQPCLLEILQLVSYPKALIYFQGWSKNGKTTFQGVVPKATFIQFLHGFSKFHRRTPFHCHENSQIASIHTVNAGSQIVSPYLSLGFFGKNWSPKLPSFHLIGLANEPHSALDCDVVPWFFEVSEAR